ncbi:hypothetical protein [Microseira wollei]|uniref:Sigma-70 family RNA polymerase sigma factor n=1 Tax=Microseira wollei NIES-4236 TaxID=2530354 RepID=A0AAV3XIE1_9CYAN|nr:hypothetical protein [Microseira wollei]GET40740.1 hypothetical protein MiSe_55510 [Microseira wollei NIES-4236]
MHCNKLGCIYSGLQPREGKRYRFVCVAAALMLPLHKPSVYLIRVQTAICRNLDRYDPAKGSVITWLDKYLRWRLQDCREEQKQEQDRTVVNFPITAEDTIDPIDNLPASPDIPLILAETYEWVATDPDGELSATQVKGYPHVTCQVILLRRLPPEMTWKAIAQEFGVPLSTVANFYKRECLPRLRKFAQERGYLE